MHRSSRPSATHVLRLLALAGALCTAACSSIRSTSYAHGGVAAYEGQVRVVSLDDPPGVEVGIIQTTANVGEPFAEVLNAFAAEAGRVGGDTAKVDRIHVTYEMVTTMQTQTYPCGTSQAPQTCTRSVPVTNEVGTINVMGRAFRSRP